MIPPAPYEELSAHSTNQLWSDSSQSQTYEIRTKYIPRIGETSMNFWTSR